MPSLKDLKNRINSVKSTRKITKAMNMVAAAKLRRAQEAAEASRPYAERMEAVMSGLAASVGDSTTAPRLLAGSGKDDVHMLVVLTSERGLCGGFNGSIAKLARQRAQALKGAGKTVKILTVGKKARELLKRDLGAHFVGHMDVPGGRGIAYAEVQPLAQKLLDGFEAGEFDVCTMFYAKFVSVIAQEPAAPQLIPASFEAPAEGEAAAADTMRDYEPGEEAVLAELLPRAITTKIFSALLENAASEQGARMSAMDNATRNAGDMIDKLNLQYNRSRQAAITNELIEIISGAEAL